MGVISEDGCKREVRDTEDWLGVPKGYTGENSPYYTETEIPRHPYSKKVGLS